MKVLFFVFFKKKKKSSFSDISDVVPSLGSSSQAAPDLGLPLRLASRLNPLAHVKAAVMINGHEYIQVSHL